ncbi:MAG: SUMF1/EgtB/PvdO family nonheme iron enzyme [Saprospiraceae bacterium]|nr:SUMF1/EgtB/PvdO family nonheme iron enzyme [Saprospiraceae bacterium]
MNPLPLRAFVMYAHEDKPVRDKLLQHLRPLEKSGALRLWSDHEIKPGELWDQEIRRRLGESDLIVMLVSDDFFNSDYIHDVEMTEALDRHNRGASRLLPASPDIGAVAWYRDNSDDKTHSVKGKTPNELGLYDMSGNVWEWCADWWGDYPDGSVRNPIGPTSGVTRVVRGCCWYNTPRFCRSAVRYRITPEFRSTHVGFRLASSPQ